MRQGELTVLSVFTFKKINCFHIVEPQLIEEGILVWCKWQRFPYWPAVVSKNSSLPYLRVIIAG